MTFSVDGLDNQSDRDTGRPWERQFKSFNNSVRVFSRHMGIKIKHEQEDKMDGDSRILQIHEVLPHSENTALMQCCDCYVSLHRSEGFGLTLAESMLMGKPVITTGYSGNMDFTNPETALLVDYKLVQVQPGDYPFSRGEMWAEPNVQQACEYMRELVEDSTFARPLAQKGVELIRNSFSTTSMGKRYKKRLSTFLM